MSVSRRSFLQQAGVGIGAVSVLPLSKSVSMPENLEVLQYDELLSKLIALNDEVLPKVLAQQLGSDSGRWAGGLVSNYDIPNAHSTSSFVMRASIALCNEKSSYYNNQYLIQSFEKALECMLRVQYDDGSIDLYSTNFHSTPDTAFIVNDFVPAYKILKKSANPALAKSTDSLYTFLKRAGKCLSVGGIHTANHRWVVSSALACMYSIHPEQKYVDRIDEWLSEGIDQDSDGQYSERSASVYSPICDHMFMTIGRLLDRPELMDIVRKNLEMSMYYIQPGGEVLTEASDRQDKAVVAYVDRYYLSYRYFAHKDGNGKFTDVCRLIENRNLAGLVSSVPDLMEDSIFHKQIVEPKPISVDYFKHFKDSGVIRIRRQMRDVSIIENNPTFLVYMNGQSILQSMRLSAAFYGDLGRFVPEKTEVVNNSIVLTKSVTHGYYQVIPKEKRTGVDGWHEYPRRQRTMSEVQTLNYKVVITENNGAVTMEMSIEGTDNIPVSCEMNFRSGGLFEGVEVDEHSADSYFLKDDEGRYIVGKDQIVFGPGKVEHRWAQMRGMLPKQEGNSVYLTGYTPFFHKITLR